MSWRREESLVRRIEEHSTREAGLLVSTPSPSLHETAPWLFQMKIASKKEESSCSPDECKMSRLKKLLFHD